ncbi:MAG TPA: class I adenylate-forming enzyme family protein [Vicinamibacterales bacterium]|jgi:acyl-coenzyme A synthetase/AMP-(fatty) acid ligase
MTTEPRALRLGAERLATTFAGDPDRPFLREGGEVWTVGRLLAYAADVDHRLPRDAGPAVGVRSHSAAFVVASLLGLWKSNRLPLLIDPSLAAEPSGLRSSSPRMPVLAPAGVTDPWADVLVAETGGGLLDPHLPLADEAEVGFFTSGSTGEPKIVRKRAYQLGEQHAMEAPWLGLSGPISVLCLVPAFHILGYIYGFSTPAAGGGVTTFSRGASPQAWVEHIAAEQPTLIIGVPSHYRLMAQVSGPSLPRAIYLCSGGPLDPAVAAEFERRAGTPVLQVYGSTETGGIATRLGAGPWRTMPGLAWERRKLDGRLLITSAWQDRPQEWYCTDDVIASDGETFRLLGRADSIVKIGGRRFSTGELVQAALTAPHVEQAHAVVYDRFGELAVALFVVSPRDAVVTPADVRTFLAGRLAPFKLPRTIQVVNELPTRSIGKIDDEALRESLSRG